MSPGHRRPTRLLRAVYAAALSVGVLVGFALSFSIPAAFANHTYGEWHSVPANMVGDSCDSIDGGSPTVLTIGEHAMYHDTAGTRFVVTMAGRVCSS